MNRAFYNAYKPGIGLLIGNVLLLAVLVGERQFHALHRERFAQSLQQERRTAGLFAELPDYEFAFGSADDYLDIVNQPLFLEGRLPVENAGEAPSKAVQDGNASGGGMDLSLSGVALLPDAILALLTDKTGKHFRVKKGETVAGWEVESVESDKVVLSNGTEHRELLLREFKAPKKPPSPPAASAPAAPNRGAPLPGKPATERPPAANPPPVEAPDAEAENNAQESIEGDGSDVENADQETENQ